MIEILSWSRELARKLREAFGSRLLFLGYQGSYGRGEATERSDIDIVTVLDRVCLSDLDTYRELAGAQPSGDLCCGFLCGREELLSWPRYDLLGLVLDTKPVLGSLEELVPPFTESDRRQALGIGASGLYHAAVHTWLYGDPAAALQDLQKSAFFTLRMLVLCREGRYLAAKRDLLPALSERERRLLAPAPFSPEELREFYEQLIAWSGEVMKKYGET